MIWIAIALFATVLFGIGNVLDNHLAARHFKDPWTLVFFITLLGAVFLPLVFLLDRPGLPPLRLLPWFILLAGTEVFYLYPYYKALQAEDTSVVASLFTLVKIFIPLLAFLIVGESLRITQYLGFFVIVLCGGLLAADRKQAFRLNRSFFLMALSSLLISLNAVLYKFIFNDVGWGTGFFWTVLFSIVIVLGFLAAPRLRSEIFRSAGRLRSQAGLVFLDAVCSFGGLTAATYARSLVPVTMEQSIDSFQPFFVLLYALALKRRFPRAFRESTDRRSLIRKFALFAVMVLGAVLVVS